MQNEFYQDKIDAYLRDELPETERNLFEQMLHQDPMLKGEVEFQQEIIRAIQSYRKSQLKNRFNTLDIEMPTVFWGTLNSSVGQLTTAIGGIGLLIGLSWYWITNNQTTNEVKVKNHTQISPQKKLLSDKQTDRRNAIAPTPKEAEITKIEKVQKDDTQDIKSNASQKEATPARTQILVPKKDQVLTPHTTNTINKEKEDVKKEEGNVNDKPQSIPVEGIEIPQNTNSVVITNPDLYLISHPNKVLYRFKNGNPEKKPGKLVGLIRQFVVNNEYYWVYGGNYYSLDRNNVEYAEPTLIKDKNLIEEIQKLEKSLER